uniref:Uncharacterized protein n=1 Tax=Arundo donax TaxID=35708 RepID=A0A0A9DKK4_ARUDO
MSHLHLLGVAADQELVGAEVLERLLALARGRADDGDLHPERLAELDGDVAEAVEPDDAEVLAGDVQAVPDHWAVHGHAGAEEGGGAVQRKAVGDADHVVLVDDDGVGETAPRDGAAVRVVHAVGGEHDAGAVVLETLAAALAGAAGADEVAHAHRVAGLELGDAAADADDLVPTRANQRGKGHCLISILVLASY